MERRTQVLDLWERLKRFANENKTSWEVLILSNEGIEKGMEIALGNSIDT